MQKTRVFCYKGLIHILVTLVQSNVLKVMTFSNRTNKTTYEVKKLIRD